MAEEKYVPRLKTKYNNEVKQQLQDKFQYENVMMIPKFEKIVVNMGVGEAATDSKAIDGAVRDLRAITGQQPMITRARKSIATFRLRAGMPIGVAIEAEDPEEIAISIAAEMIHLRRTKLVPRKR